MENWFYADAAAPSRPALKQLQQNPTGGWDLQIEDEPAGTFPLQRTTNLLTWEDLQTGSLTTGQSNSPRARHRHN
jgi:hypothetical protein